LKTLPKLMEVTAVPGLSMGVLQDGKLVWQKDEGVADAGSRKPVTPDSLFPAASLGKPAFAYTALRLADDGKLDLDRPLKTYVPDHAPADARGDKVTARHVLSHSTGFRNWRNSAEQPLTPDFDPGSRFQYSGEGFYYLQRAVEKITGGAFEAFMQTRLFEPFGMRASTYGWREDTDARLVTGHNRGNPVRGQSRDFANRLFQYAQSQGKPLAAFTHEDVVTAMNALKPSPPMLPNFMIPNSAGSMLTTIADYATYLSHVLAPSGGTQEITPKTRERMLTPATRINSVLSWGRMGPGERPGARLLLALGRQRQLQGLRPGAPAVAFGGRGVHERQQRHADQRSHRRRCVRPRAFRVRLVVNQLPAGRWQLMCT
jgi:CubicO group peptidase (beta-lactamase class C family)